MPSATDALGRIVTLERPPTRVVSLVPSVTEAIVALGLGRNLAAVTKFCVEPAEVTASLRKIGGTKDPDVDAIAALEPDLVLANVEENRRQDVQALIDAGLTVFVGYPRSVREAVDEFQTIGQLMGAPASPRAVNDAREAVERQETLNETRPRVRVFCPIWRNPYMAVAGDTYAGDLIRLAGGQNVFESHPSGSRYPQVTLKEIQEADPQLILLPDEPFRFRPRHRDELKALRDVDAVRADRLFLCDGRWLTWYGPRIAEGLEGVELLLDRARPTWTAPADPARVSERQRAKSRKASRSAKPAQPSAKKKKKTTAAKSTEGRSTSQRRPPKPRSAPGEEPPLPPGLRFNVDVQDVVDEGRS